MADWLLVELKVLFDSHIINYNYSSCKVLLFTTSLLPSNHNPSINQSQSLLLNAIPTGIKILNRLATIRSSRFSLITPLYLIIGFPFSSTFGGFTGPIPANSNIDTILHDSYFIIGHPHHAPSSGAIYTISAAFYTYWIFYSSISFSDVPIGSWPF